MKYRKDNQIPHQLLSLVLCLAILLALFPGLTPAVYAAETQAAEPAYATREYIVSEFVQSVGRNTMGKSDYILSTFSDADEIDEAYVDDMSRAVNQGILRGYTDHSLHPRDSVRRIEALVMLSRILPDLEPIQDPIPFTDVPAWAKEDIDRLSAAGIVKGYGHDRLGSNDYITVEQVGLLTDRSDALLNRYTPGESFYAYINDKVFRNYIPGESVVDPIHGVVVPGVDGWSTFGDRTDEIAAQEKALLRKLGSGRLVVSFDEPLNTDWDGNELLLSDVLGTDADEISRAMEADAEKQLLMEAVDRLEERERQIIVLRFGLKGREELTQKQVADLMGISQSYISRLEKRIILRLRREMSRMA